LQTNNDGVECLTFEYEYFFEYSITESHFCS